MKISSENRKRLVDEIQFVRKKMKEEKDPEVKIYYYSAVFGLVDRIFKTEYDPQLVFMHYVLQVSYSAISFHIESVKRGQSVVPLLSDYFDNLESYLAELQEKIKNEEDGGLYLTFERIICHTYLTMGPGYYLSMKGIKVVQ